MEQAPQKYSIYSNEPGPMENFVYLIHDHASNTAAIVDPAGAVQEALKFGDAKGIRITDILLTHSHHDHNNGLHKRHKSTAMRRYTTRYENHHKKRYPDQALKSLDSRGHNH